MEHIFCLTHKKLDTDKLALVYLIFGCVFIEPRVLSHGVCHVNFVALRVLSLIHTVSYLCIVELDFFNIAQIEVHSG